MCTNWHVQNFELLFTCNIYPIRVFSKLFILLFFFNICVGQVVTDSLKNNLPFAIHNSKKLSDEDLIHKKEGIYVTGLPQFGYDPINKFSFGLQGTIFQDGKRTDPFFPYTPYRYRIDLSINRSSKNEQEYILGADVPFIGNTKWRFRANIGYYTSPNTLYFGDDENTLESLSYYPNGDTTLNLVENATFDAYTNNLVGLNSNYHAYVEEYYFVNPTMEHSFFGGRVRFLGGFEFDIINMKSHNGTSKLVEDVQKLKTTGLGSQFFTSFQTGIVYDTRNLETDPSSGVFAELTNAFAIKGLGSVYNINKTFAQAKIYFKILPKVFKKAVFASRFGIGATSDNAPFWQQQFNWSSEIPVFGLPLRGYKTNRFLGNVMSFANIELRVRFLQFKILKQHLAFSVVPMLDVGGVFNDLGRIFMWDNYRYSTGLGARIAWNINTILRFDYAISDEDNQFFFGFGNYF